MPLLALSLNSDGHVQDAERVRLQELAGRRSCTPACLQAGTRAVERADADCILQEPALAGRSRDELLAQEPLG